jgi:hypothetical protein
MHEIRTPDYVGRSLSNIDFGRRTWEYIREPATEEQDVQEQAIQGRATQEVATIPKTIFSMPRHYATIFPVYGEPLQCLPKWRNITAPIGEIDTVEKLYNVLEGCGMNTPFERLGLDLRRDTLATLFLFTDEKGVRHSRPLEDIHEKTGAIGRWKRHVEKGELAWKAPCNCITEVVGTTTIGGEPGHIHEPSVYLMISQWKLRL